MKVAFYDTKAYDKPSFEYYGGQNGVGFRFLETKLTEDTVSLAEGCDAVCVFVNDDVNAEVIEKLYEEGVKLIALRSAGYNNVDVHAAYGKIHVVHVPRILRTPSPNTRRPCFSRRSDGSTKRTTGRGISTFP